MPICKKCQKTFSKSVKIDGKIKQLSKRKYCLECSPFKNTSMAHTSTIENNYKTCPSCKRHLPVSEFYGRYSNRNIDVSSYCKFCINKRKRQLIKDIKQKAIEYKGGKCELCNYNKCISALEFHHRNPKKKDFKISDYNSPKFGILKKELDKCQLLCSNCHREIHEK
jgi:hypothetical protein